MKASNGPATLSPLLDVVRLVVGLALLPHLPDDGRPTIGQPAVAIGVRTTARADVAPVGQGPTRLLRGGLGELLGDTAELAVATTAEEDNPALATLLGNGAGTGQGLNGGRSGEAIPVVTELGQELAGSGQWLEGHTAQKERRPIFPLAALEATHTRAQRPGQRLVSSPPPFAGGR